MPIIQILTLLTLSQAATGRLHLQVDPELAGADLELVSLTTGEHLEVSCLSQCAFDLGVGTWEVRAWSGTQLIGGSEQELDLLPGSDAFALVVPFD
ncbi:MAG: hypothetical protein ACI9VR_001680 [Cognaticolwellia sp.]|jgi:hypothetical protein